MCLVNACLDTSISERVSASEALADDFFTQAGGTCKITHRLLIGILTCNESIDTAFTPMPRHAVPPGAALGLRHASAGA